MDNIVLRINELMNYYNLSQKQLSQKSQVDSSHLSKVLNGRLECGSGVKSKLLLAFPNVNRDWLLYGEGEMLNGMIRQEVNGNDNTSIAGNGNNVNNSSALERAIDEIAAMRELLQEQVKNNKEQFDRFMCIIEKLSK